jgi:hypothetical protein
LFNLRPTLLLRWPFDLRLSLLIPPFLLLGLWPLPILLLPLSLPLLFLSLWLLPLQLPPFLLMLPDLGPLLILCPSLIPQLLPLFFRPGPIVLDAPGPLSFPISIGLPVAPVTVKPMVRNPFIVPVVSVPVAVPVVPSPSRVYIIIKKRNTAVVSPAPVIIMRAIPAAAPWTPPPAIPEKNVDVYIGHNVDIVCIRHHDHLRRCRENDRRRQRKSNTDAYIHLCPCGSRNGDCQCQKD